VTKLTKKTTLHCR